MSGASRDSVETEAISYQSARLPRPVSAGSRAIYIACAVISWIAAFLVLLALVAFIVMIILLGPARPALGGLVAAPIAVLLFWAAIYFTRRAAGK